MISFSTQVAHLVTLEGGRRYGERERGGREGGEKVKEGRKGRDG